MSRIPGLVLALLLGSIVLACDGDDCAPLKAPVEIEVSKRSIHVNGCEPSLIKHPFFAPGELYSKTGDPSLKSLLAEANIKEVRLDVPGTLSYIDFLRIFWNIQMSTVDRVVLSIDKMEIGNIGIFLSDDPEFEIRQRLFPESPGDFQNRTVEYRAELNMQMNDLREDLIKLQGAKIKFNYFDVF